ncbi:MAG TPA: ABC transporter substrate-binding protein [Syntrophorhabdales bacterium]|nr:ABC transporter substrate-binding protein [Syntrophorhabdales bacterium]
MEKTRREFVKLVGGAAVGAGMLLAGRGKAGAQAKPVKGVPSEPVMIGAMPGLSGVIAVPGTAAWRTTQMWVEEVNAAGGILGRKIELSMEEETTAKDCVERFRKLTLEKKCDVIVGLMSTGNGLAVGPLAEELGQLWLAWDATTQKGVEETMPKTKFSFKSTDNEAEAIGGAILTAKFFPNIKTVVGINNDYSYGRDCWDAYQAVLKNFNPNVKFVDALWPKLGETDFTSHIAALKRANADLIMTSFWSGDVPILMKQATAAGLFKRSKACFTTGGGAHYTLKKEFTPEGIILGYNSFYFRWTDTWPLLKKFVNAYYTKYKEYPVYECDHAYFVLQAYKEAVEKCYQILGRWPTKEEIGKVLSGIQVPSLSGFRGYREDNIMSCNFFMGLTSHKNPYDFVTISEMEVLTPVQIMKPFASAKLYDWIKGWKS